jgi:hypothetical protein
MPITPDNPNIFKPASIIYAKVKRDLSSFEATGLIDEGEFPTHIKHVLKMLGIGVYKEQEAFVAVKNFKACLPGDFSKLYSAYKCSPFINQTERVHQQGAPISVYNDVSWALLKVGENCDIPTCDDEEKPKILEQIVVRQYVKEHSVNIGFGKFIPLRLSPNVLPEALGDDCVNIGCASPYEISIAGNMLYTNFSQDSVYLKYYAFPVDENGVPEIPDIEEVEKAIEWCIKYELLMNMWLNNQVPDLQNRWQFAQQQYNYWMAEAKKYINMPSFLNMVNVVRRQRAVNKVAIFTK